MKNSKKMKKAKFVTLKELSMLFMINDLKIPFVGINKLKYYKLKKNESNDKTLSLDIFNSKGVVNVDKIKWVKVTVPETFIDKIKLNEYKYEGKKIKLVKPEYDTDNKSFVGIIIPIEIFKVMLSKYMHKNNPYHLSYLLNCSNNPFSIKLLNSNKKEIAYVIDGVEMFI